MTIYEAQDSNYNVICDGYSLNELKLSQIQLWKLHGDKPEEVHRIIAFNDGDELLFMSDMDSYNKEVADACEYDPASDNNFQASFWR